MHSSGRLWSTAGAPASALLTVTQCFSWSVSPTREDLRGHRYLNLAFFAVEHLQYKSDTWMDYETMGPWAETCLSPHCLGLFCILLCVFFCLFAVVLCLFLFSNPSRWDALYLIHVNEVEMETDLVCAWVCGGVAYWQSKRLEYWTVPPLPGNR